MRDIEENADFPWLKSALSLNPNITWEYIVANPNTVEDVLFEESSRY